MFPERLKRARKAAGLSMAALAAEIDLSANAIKKYEHGEAMPGSGNLLKLAKALGVRSEYFFRPNTVELSEIEYRKRSNAPKKLLAKITGDVVDQAERWSELLDLYPDTDKPVSPFEQPTGVPDAVEDLETVETIAIDVRRHWHLGLNPIPDMIDTLESKGIMVLSTSIEKSDKFDGLTATVNGTPIIVVSTLKPGDRQRFTLAHELGHLILSGRLKGMDEEKACHRFAGAFLLPREALIQQFGRVRHAIEMRELYMLKHEFGISMMAILMRLHHCNVISKNLMTSYQIEMGKRRWRQVEPGDPYPSEETFFLKQIVYRALSEDYIGESKAAELLGMSLSAFHRERMLEKTDEAAHQ